MTELIAASIASITLRRLAADPPVQLVRLTLPLRFAFHAGQYLEIVHPDGTRIPLSIASPPDLLPELELHYRSTPGLQEANRLDELLTRESELTVDGPMGAVHLLLDDDRPLVLIAGGTGIAQSLSLGAAQAMRHPRTTVRLLACAERTEDLYFKDLLPLSKTFDAKLIADTARDGNNQGLRWMRENAETFMDPESRIIISGSPPFVYAVTDVLVDVGCPANQIESDVYAYAPR